jgi:hypothetical protein
MPTEIIIVSGETQFREAVALRFSEPVKLPQSTASAIASLYPASAWAFCAVAVIDGTSNKYLAVSNGSAWYYMDGSPV